MKVKGLRKNKGKVLDSKSKKVGLERPRLERAKANTSRPFGVLKLGSSVAIGTSSLHTPENLSRSKATSLVNALNREWRAHLFAPKNAGRRSRSKGHSFEREVAIMLREIFPEAARQLEYQLGDCKGVDIKGTDQFKIQCKKLRDYAPVSTIGEIQCDRSLGDVPIVVTAADNKEAMAILPLTELLRLIKAYVP